MGPRGWTASGLAGLLLTLAALPACTPRETAPLPGGASRAPLAAPPGPLIVDTREPADFAAGHAPGAINLQRGWDQLRYRVEAYVPDKGTEIRLVAASDEDAREGCEVLRALGYERVSIEDPPGAGATLELVTAAELRERLASASPPTVLDVRTPLEWARDGIDGAIRLEQDSAPARIDELDPGGNYAVICEAGYRSGQLASWMRRHGFERVVNVIDGMAGWRDLPPAAGR